jgi:hypothetical protein
MKKLFNLFGSRISSHEQWKQECSQGVKAVLTQPGGNRNEIHSSLVELKKTLTGSTAPIVQI